MKNRKLSVCCLIIMLLINSGCKTSKITDNQQIVSDLNTHLNDWGKTKDVTYRTYIESQCDKGCRVSDVIMNDYGRKSNLGYGSYLISSYLNCFQTALKNGPLDVSSSGYRVINADEKDVVSSEFSKRHAALLANKITNVACDLRVSGSLNYNVSDLYYIHNGKILKIDSLAVSYDKNGEKKIRVDIDDIVDSYTLGFSLNYDQHFPIGASFIIQGGWLFGSLDFGVNLDSKRYTRALFQSTDLWNYRKEVSTCDPKCFITITPGLNLKYLSFGCGFGAVRLSRNAVVAKGNGDSSSNSNNLNSEYESSYFKFMLRPQVRAYIPVSSNLDLSVGVGYDIIAKMKELNGYNFSLGFHFYWDY